MGANMSTPQNPRRRSRQKARRTRQLVAWRENHEKTPDPVKPRTTGEKG
jgi:hypothetical protein